MHMSYPITPILDRINPIPRIEHYFFKIHSTTVLASTPSLPKGLFPLRKPVRILKLFLPSSICPAHLHLPDLIT